MTMLQIPEQIAHQRVMTHQQRIIDRYQLLRHGLWAGIGSEPINRANIRLETQGFTHQFCRLLRTLEQVIGLLMRGEPKTDVDFISTSGFN